MASMITIKFGAPNNRYTHGVLQKWFFGVKFGKEIIGCILTFILRGDFFRFPRAHLSHQANPEGPDLQKRWLDIQQNMQNITRIAIDLWFSMVESNSNKSTWTNPRTMTCFFWGGHPCYSPSYTLEQWPGPTKRNPHGKIHRQGGWQWWSAMHA